MNDNTNIGFTPEKTFLADANDKIIVESFDSFGSGTTVTIQDPSVKDADILTIALSAQNINAFGDGNVTIKNIETIHINTTGAVSSITNNAKIEGLKVLEIAGDTGNLHVNGYDASGKPLNTNFNVGKIDASGITVGNVYLTADTATTELVGGAGSDELTIGSAGGTMTGNAGGDKFFVGAAHDKLVTITDISKGDVVNFGTAINVGTTKEAKALTITDASDETTFVDALQKAANKEAGNGLYYAEYNGNTYVIANGVAGTTVKDTTAEIVAKVKTASVASAAGSVTQHPTAEMASATSATGSVTWKDVNITGSWDGSAATLTAASGASLTGNITVSKTSDSSTLTAKLDVTSGTPTVSFATSALTATSKIKVNGVEYSLSDFAEFTLSGKSDITFDINGMSSKTIESTASTFSGYALTGVTGGEVGVTGILAGVMNGTADATKDDIIVKLAGSHTLNTEATLGDYSLSF